MESHPPPFNPNPWDPLPPPPPPPNFQWGNPGFPGDGFPQFQPFHPPPDHSFAAAGGGYCQPPPPQPQPQPKPQFQRKRKFDRVDDGSFVKLYVGGIPRTVTQDEIFCLFQEHGNVVEVVLLPDKWTGQQQEYCFVKYAFTEEADRAIIALNNQFTFPEAMAPIRVRYADGARQRQGLERPVQHDSCLARPGLMQNDSTTFSGPGVTPIVGQTLHKLYVNGFNKEASKREIEEIFSAYGVVADIYLLRDESKQIRGCGFVGFTQRHMAEAAISALNGTYVMKGCDGPLVVRFAEPKKPKNGELRPTPNPVDMRGSNKSNALHLGNPSNSMQVNTTGIQGGSFPTVGNRLECPVNEMQKTLHKPISPSRFSQMSLQHSQPLKGSPQPSRQTESQLSTPLHSNQKSNNSIEQQNDDQSPQTCRDTGSNSVMLISEPASCPSRSDLSENPIDCDWSEHICPDGCKYYFNCVTCESRWEKPKEFALYEQQLKGRQAQKHSCQEPHPSALEASSVEEEGQIQEAQDQKEPCDFEQPQLAISCSVEHSHEQVQAETSALGGPSFVQ